MTTEAILYVVDDDLALRDSLFQMATRMQLQAECFASADTFLESFNDTQPSCLVLDVKMPGMSGIDLQKKLADDGKEIPIIMITGHGDVPLGVRAMKQGAIDFLEKQFHPKQLAGCIREALRIDAQHREQRSRYGTIQSRFERLTEQERDVMKRIVAGKPNKVIAAELDVSLRTVQYRRSSIMEKMEVDSKAALIEQALEADGHLGTLRPAAGTPGVED